jgi:hypothetical protein
MKHRRAGLRCAATTALVTVCIIPVCASATGSLTDRSLRVVRADEAPLIDGILDDACWSTCAITGEFFDMGRGCSPTQATEVRVCFDEWTRSRRR